MTRQVQPIEALERFWQHRMLDVHTSLVARVVAYYPAKMTVDVEPQVAHHLIDEDDNRVPEELPVLYGVPVGFMRAGGFSITLPVAVGDTVHVQFCEEPTQTFRSKKRKVKPGFTDRHGLNGGVAYPITMAHADRATASEDGIVLQKDDGSGAIVIKDGEVLLGDATATAAATNDLLLQQVLVALVAAITAAAPVAMDGGAGLKASLLAGLAAWPSATAATKVKVA